MDLFALGTPVIDLFARVDGAALTKLGVKKGATNYFSAKKLAAIERALGKKIAYAYPGDNARNVCEGFAALSGFCAYQGTVGSDAEAAFFASSLAECGIGDFLQEKEGSTGKIVALVTPDAQRTFCADLGVSSQCDRFEKIAISQARMLFLTSITLSGKFGVAALAQKYLAAFRKMGKPIAISLENPPMVARQRAALLVAIKKYADVLFMNGDEARALLGPLFMRKLPLLKPGIPIYLKMGKAGSVLFLRKKAHNILPMKANVVDTTGAGDAYAAGALYGISRGYSALGSGRLGCMVATAVVGKEGAGIPLGHTRIRIRHRKIGAGKKD